MQRVIKLSKASKVNNTKVYIIDGRLKAIPKNLPLNKKAVSCKAAKQEFSVFGHRK